MLSWITNEWRLKLLSLGLAVLVLGAVAFSQNPPTTRPITVPLSYTVPPNIVLINPPAKTTVTISGLADVIQRADSSNVIATVDATRALPGSAVKLNIQARSLTPLSIGIPQQPAPIAVNVDTYQTVTLPVQVNARAAPGWNIDSSKTVASCTTASVPANRNPCKVVFSGPVSWETNLRAVAILQGNALGVQDALNQSVTLLNANGQLDLAERTVPATAVDVTAVDIHTEAVQGTTSAPVALVDSPPSNPPPQGYRVTAVSITPLIVTMTGDPSVIQRVRTIVLPPVDLSGSTADATFQVAIPYPSGVSGSVANATVKYSISKNPNIPPSP